MEQPDRNIANVTDPPLRHQPNLNTFRLRTDRRGRQKLDHFIGIVGSLPAGGAIDPFLGVRPVVSGIELVIETLAGSVNPDLLNAPFVGGLAINAEPFDIFKFRAVGEFQT